MKKSVLLILWTCEKYSIEYINSEIYKKSKFYQKLLSEKGEKNEE